MEGTFMQAVKPSRFGVDVYAHSQGKLMVFRNVVENVVRCALGRDYPYWERKSTRSVKEYCRPLRNDELKDFSTQTR